MNGNGSGVRHVVWDFNGTLLDDVPYILDATRHAFAEIGLPEVSDDEYRLHYSRPLVDFYTRLVGRTLSAEEWAHLNDVWHAHYLLHEPTIPLAEGAHEVLAAVTALGWTQSVCSMHRQGQVEERLRELGIAHHFVRIDGIRDRHSGGATKHELLAAHLEALTLEATGAVMIGDSLDDLDAARALGMPAVLVKSGIHHEIVLADAGVEPASSLAEAFRHAQIHASAPSHRRQPSAR